MSDQMNGSRVVTVGPVTLACTRPEASDLLDRAVQAWKRDHPGQDPCDALTDANGRPFTPYRTLYWLCRWSGIFSYTDTTPAPPIALSEGDYCPLG